jgi:dolichol-phosphate mannosyltransferase
MGRYIVPVLSDAQLKLSLIVPTYQEADNIQEFLAQTCQVLEREIPGKYEVIVVDDESPDGTWRLAHQMTSRYPAIHVMRRKGERGLAKAVVRGYQAAKGELLATINADFQHPPQVLAAMLHQAQQSEVVVASRFCPGAGTGDWPLERLFLSFAAVRTGKLLLPNVFSGITDPLSGYYLFRRSVIDGIELAPMGFKTLIEILARGRARSVTECPYEMRSRRRGSSKATFESSLSFLKQLRHLRDAA